MGSSKGFTIVEQGHVVNILPPASAVSALTSDSFLMENWGHASIIIQNGVGSVCTITVFDSASSGASGASMIFNYTTEQTAAGDTLAVLAAATTAGTAMPGDDNTMMVIEIDADELRDGFPWILIRADATTANYISAVAILSGGRYQKDITATVIA